MLHTLLKQNLVWRVFYLVSAFLLNFCLARLAGAAISGTLFYFTNLFSFLVLLGSFSLESSFTYFASGNAIAKKQLASVSLIWVLAIGFLGFVFFSIYASQIKTGSNDFLIYGLLFVIGNVCGNFFQALFYADKNFATPNIVQGCMNIVLVLVLWIEKQNQLPVTIWIGTFFIFSLLNGLILLIVFILKEKSFPLFSLPGYHLIQQIFRYASLAFAANIIFFLEYRVDYWFVQRNCNANELGNYIQASKLSHMLLLLPQMLAAFVFPMVADGREAAGMKNIIEKLSRLLMQWYILLFSITLLIGKWVFPFLLGNSFTHIYQPFLYLIPGITCLSLLSLLSAYFGGKNKVSINIKGALIGCTVVLAGNIFTLTFYSIQMAAIVNSIGYGVNFLYAWNCYTKDETVQPGTFFRWSYRDWKWLQQILLSKI